MTQVLSATVEDIPELARLFEDYRMFYRQPPAPEAALVFVSDHVTRQLTQFFVARSEGPDLAGFVHLLPTTSTLPMRPAWILEDLFVAPAQRRKGIGEALMLHAEQFARQSGAERLTLSTARDNHTAQALYRKLGWVLDEPFLHFNRFLL